MVLRLLTAAHPCAAAEAKAQMHQSKAPRAIAGLLLFGEAAQGDGWQSTRHTFRAMRGIRGSIPFPRRWSIIYPQIRRHSGAARAVWAEPGICILAARADKNSEIPGSIADEAGDGPGMTMFL